MPDGCGASGTPVERRGKHDGLLQMLKKLNPSVNENSPSDLYSQ